MTNDSPTEDTPRKENLKKSIALFGEDEENLNLDTAFTYEVNIPKDATDNILKISRAIKVAVLTISGYEEQPSNDKNSTSYKLVKHPLASSEVIKAFESILKPYSDESNMVSKKTWDSFKIQALADWGAFYKFCLREKASPDTNERTVYRVFQGCIINIGEITCDNPTNMTNLWGSINRERREDDERNTFK